MIAAYARRVRIHKLESTTAFVAIDLDGAEASSGPIRWARKILQGGAKDLARSQTYTYAALGMQRGGASGGISADGPDRDAAVAAAVTELAGLTADGTYLPDAAKGVAESDLAPLREADPRDTARLGGAAPTLVDRAEGLGIAACAAATLGGLDGRSVAIDGFAANGPALAASAVERGATIVAVSTAAGLLADPSGLDPATLADAWGAHGADLVTELGGTDGSALGAAADVVVAGAKTGTIDHRVAAGLAEAAAVVPCGRLALTAKGLATLRRAGVPAAADFVALAGSTLALWGDPHRTEAEILAGVAEDIGALAAEYAGHDDGPLLAACYDAESFLGTWRETLPFGRPLAP